MTIANELAGEMEAFCEEARKHGVTISPSTVGERAGQGGRFYQRMPDGRRLWPETAEKVRAWMRDNAKWS